jgi:NADPH:quinone reductase-like Zn-dependent oxidoreductase
VEFVRSLGADHVVDYMQRDFAAGPERYDVIFDNVENRSLANCRRALTPGGLLILNSGTGTRGLKTLVRLLKPLVISPSVRQTLRRYLTVPKHEDLVALALIPVIDRTYSLRFGPRSRTSRPVTCVAKSLSGGRRSGLVTRSIIARTRCLNT